VKRLVGSGFGSDLPLLFIPPPCRSEQAAGNLEPVRTQIVDKSLLCIQYVCVCLRAKWKHSSDPPISLLKELCLRLERQSLGARKLPICLMQTLESNYRSKGDVVTV
jgi:hypothetical protein